MNLRLVLLLTVLILFIRLSASLTISALDEGLRRATEAQVATIQYGTDTTRVGWWAEALRHTVQEGATAPSMTVPIRKRNAHEWLLESTVVSLALGEVHLDVPAALGLGLMEAALLSVVFLYAAQGGALWLGLWRRIPFGKGTARRMLNERVAGVVFPAALIAMAFTALLTFIAWHVAREWGWVQRLFVSDIGVVLTPLVCAVAALVFGTRHLAVSRCRRAAATLTDDRVCARCGYDLSGIERCSECGTERSAVPLAIPVFARGATLAFVLAFAAYAILAFWPLNRSSLCSTAAGWRSLFAVPSLGQRGFDSLYVSHRSPSRVRMDSGERLVIHISPVADSGGLELLVADPAGKELVRQTITPGTRSEVGVGGGKLVYIGDNFGPATSPTKTPWHTSLFVIEPSFSSAETLANEVHQN